MGFIQILLLLSGYDSQVIFSGNALDTLFLLLFPLILECLNMVRSRCMSLTIREVFTTGITGGAPQLTRIFI